MNAEDPMQTEFKDRLPALLKNIASSPELYLHQINRAADSGLVIEADADFYRRAIFLDQRALSAQSAGMWMPLEIIRNVTLGATMHPRAAHFIFHIGHCGSTLTSRLLAEAGGVLALREPLVLRTLSEIWQNMNAETPPAARAKIEEELEFHYRLLSRTFAQSDVAMIKATSFTSNLGAPLLTMNSANRALLLAMSAEAYVSIMLGSEDYAVDLRGFAQNRYKSLQNFLGALDFTLDELSLGELAGLAWLVELMKLKTISDVCPKQTCFQDFDEFLSDPRRSLNSMTLFFGLANDPSTLDRLMKSSILSRYSKAPQYPFDAAARAQRIEEARQKAGLEIEQGLALIESLANSRAEVSRVIENFGYSVR